MKSLASRIVALALALSLGSAHPVSAAQPAPGQAADAIYSGGPIITMNDAAPRAEAVAVKSGKILAVGTKAEVEQFRAGGTTTIDLAGKALLPGFIDAHGHVFTTGVQAASANILPAPDGEGNSIAKIQEILREYAKTEASRKFNLILGFGYDDAQIAEKRHPTRQDLDEVSKDVPILIIHQSCHLGAMNSKALELAKISADTKDPQGGVIRREADGKTPNGVLEETAFMAYAMAIFPRLNAEQFAQLAVMGQDLYITHGFTTTQEGRATGPAHSSFVRLAEAGQMKVDVVAYMDMMFTDDPPEMKTPWYSREYKNGYRIGGVKLNLDGSIQGKTGYLGQPYLNAPEGSPTNYRGYETVPDAVVAGKVDKAYANGWQVLAHANGDAAIDQYISAVRDAVAKHGTGDRRSVNIHAQTARLDQLDSMKELGIIPSFFGMHCFYWGDWHRDETLGAVRAEKISPARSALRRGMIFTQHHDSPVAQPSAIRVLSSVVTRRTRSGDILGADERIGVTEALKSLTIWSAYQHFEEKTKGSLEVGKVADFVVLSADPYAVNIEDLDELTVVETIKAGASMYKAGTKATKVGAGAAHELPRIAGVRWDEPADDLSHRPRGGIYAYAPVPGPCGCAGCTLGHIVAMGRRDVGLRE
jgi:predicted amidohydrolase YtcJ